MTQNRISKNSQKGFTLIEILIAVFFVSVGLIGVIAFFNSSLESQFGAKKELIAAGLAQEAAELVRNIADYNYLNGDDWWKNLASDSAGTGICETIDNSSLSSHNCDPDGSLHSQVCLNSSSRYVQSVSDCSGMTKTDYTRTLAVSGQEINDAAGIDLNNGDCLEIIVTVTWQDRTTAAADVVCKPRQ